MGKLTAAIVKDAMARPGQRKYGDGDGLFLQAAGGRGSWILRYVFNGKQREKGLGSASTCTLSQARKRAEKVRQTVGEGRDPIAEKQAARELAEQQAKQEAERAVTFKKFAEEYIHLHQTGWKSAKHASQWPNTMRDYVYPVIGDLPIRDVDTTRVLEILKPIWTTKTETATRVRGRIEAVLSAAKVAGHRKGDNPARWHDHLKYILPKPSEVKPPQNFAAMPYAVIGAFIKELQVRPALAARALEFTILTAVRTENTIGAVAEEFDLKAAVWTIPAARMKGTRAKAREHRVPLSKRAIEILKQLGIHDMEPGAKIFPLSNMAMLMLLQDRMGKAVTVHGFRSSFKDWAAEVTNYPNMVSEMALAHGVGEKVEAAYRHGDLFEKRRRLMNDWASFCAQEKKATGTVTPLRVV
jgi:integrase